MVYDPELDQLIIGTGAPAPSDPTKRGKDAGDELFTSAVVALDAETGAYRWHFTQVPGNAWNYEPAVGLMMATLPIDGEDRRVVLSVPKNGFVYLLDAKTGEFISGRNYVPVNWAKGLDDETGRPIFDPAARYWEAADGEPTIILPSNTGAHDWTALAFDPQKNVLFIPAMTMPERRERTASGEYSYDQRHGSQGDPEWQAFAELVAWDPVTQSEVWRQRHALPLNGGALHTAGGLVFQGTAEGYLNAYDAASGEQLGSFAAGGAIRAANAPACESRVLEGHAGWSTRPAYARGGTGRCRHGGALRLPGQHRLARIRGCQCASTSGRPGITGDGDRRRPRGLASRTYS